MKISRRKWALYKRMEMQPIYIRRPGRCVMRMGPKALGRPIGKMFCGMRVRLLKHQVLNHQRG